MEKAAIYHRPESEMAYLAGKNQFRIRLRTKHADVHQVEIIYGRLDCIKQQKLNKENVETIRPDMDAMQCILQTDLYDYWEVTIPVKIRERTQYLFHLTGDRDEELLYDAINVRPYMTNFLEKAMPFNTPYYQNMFLVHSGPEWIKHTVWYQIMVDRFDNGDESNDPLEKSSWDLDKPTNTSFYGGDLQGVIDHFNYLDELGINGIKLSPIFASYSNQKNDPIDFYDLSYMYGSKELFREFVQKAHQHGIRVMIQLPLDRMSDMSLQWQDVQRLGAQSRFASWFKVRQFPVQVPNEDEASDKNYLTVDGNIHMPRLNLQSPMVQQYLLEVARYWIETFDIDGWEILNADEIDQTFLNLMTQQMHSIKADFVVVGQYKYLPNDNLAKNYIDGANNTAFYTIMQDFFINHQLGVTDMISRINNALMKNTAYINQMLINEIENFTTPRLISECNGEKDLARAIIAFIFMQVGIPSFMYGTEIGASEGGVPGNLAPMKWKDEEQSSTMLQFMKNAISMRREYADLLNNGTLEWGQLSNKYRYFTLTREYDGQKLFCLFNFGYGNVKVVIPRNSEIVLSQNLMQDESKVAQNGFVILKV